MPRKPRKLLVVSHVVHYRHANRLYAYGPYAREIDIWADLFPEVVIAAPCKEAPPPGDAIPFTRLNISIAPQPETGGDTLLAKATQVAKLPILIWSLSKAMRRADAIHVRCPGNLGLLGVVLAPLFSRRLVAKYAGQWNGYPGEALTVRLQRWLLSSRWWHGPVTVYGKWPSQPVNIVPFFTSVMTQQQMQRARLSSRRDGFGDPLRVLYVGRLSESKNVHVLLSAVAALRSKGISLRCDIVGDGPQRAALEKQARKLGLSDLVLFAGGVDFDQALDFYEHNDILVLASESEGWPKAIAEAMAFGLVCIGSDRGLVPEMLGEGRGLIVPPGNVDALTAALRPIAVAPEQYQGMRVQATTWAQRFSLEGLREALRHLLEERWHVSLAETASTQSAPIHKPESIART